MKSFWTKDGNCLRPSSEEAESYLKKIGQGEEVQAEIKRPRNLKHHKRFMKMCNLIADNFPGNYSPRAIAGLLEHRTGHVEIIKTTTGPVEIPKPINFSDMDEVEATKVFEDCIMYVHEALIPCLPDSEFKRELEKF